MEVNLQKEAKVYGESAITAHNALKGLLPQELFECSSMKRKKQL